MSFFAQSSQLIAHRPTALGIEAASFASFSGAGLGDGCRIWGRERDWGTGAGESEQRYSGKPDGVAGTPKIESEKLKI